MTSHSHRRYDEVVVLGLGASGEAAARLLQAHGGAVTIVDASASPAVRARAAVLECEGVRVLTAQTAPPPGRFEMAVVSPGISASHPWVLDLERRGVPVISELELGWRHVSFKVLAITGSNGKSTLVKLCAEALAGAGRRIVIAGNYGTPLSAVAGRDNRPEWAVVEVSTFQMEKAADFRPDVGVLLNVNPNHLDRHGTLAAYEELKGRMFRRMRAGHTAVLPVAVPAAVRGGIPDACRRVTFGRTAEADYRYEAGRVSGRLLAADVSVSGSLFDNEVMGLTAAACVAAVQACGVDPAAVGVAAAGFKRLPHRMQPVAVVNGVEFVDDSKATNLAAMQAGILMAGGPVHLIAGGLLKEKDLAAVKKVLAKKVRGVYIIGSYSQVMSAAWRDTVPCSICGGLNEAVRRAWKEAKTGEVILLSPGCASFDQFLSFEDRGEQFKAIVRSLKEED